MAETPFALTVAGDRRLHGILQTSDRPGPRPTVVVCHGFKGFMEWGFFPHLATLLTERGFTVVRFNFTGSGMAPGEDLVTDSNAFRTATVARDLEDLEAVLAAAGTQFGTDSIDPERLGLLGHSRGGGAVTLIASRDPWRARLRSLVTWSAIGSYDRQSEEEKREWRRRGEMLVVNGRTGQQLAVDVGVLEDIESNADTYDLTAAAGRRRAPWLIVHGTADETVSLDDGRRLHGAAEPPAELLTIQDAGHTFGAVHPFQGPTPHLIEALNATQSWLRRTLAVPSGRRPE